MLKIAKLIQNPNRVVRILFVLFALWIAVLIGEVYLFSTNPPDVLGWGERPSLQPDAKLGWKLIPSRQTRLRWAGYDYVVTSNSLGFPGPEPSTGEIDGRIRIVSLGAAFTSAEGVDTEQAWPRQLERRLQKTDDSRQWEVNNLAITGYGLAQQAAALELYGAALRPQIVIMTLAPNDLGKIGTDVSSRAARIGFGRPGPQSFMAILTCQHVVWPTLRAIRNAARSRSGQGWYMGQFYAFAIEFQPMLNQREDAIAAELQSIVELSNMHESRLIALLVPASIQVCLPSDLEYFPEKVDLSDSTRWDLNQPQRSLKAALDRFDIETYDLREAFANSRECPYSPVNMHWALPGHGAVAEFVGNVILSSQTQESTDSESEGPPARSLS